KTKSLKSRMPIPRLAFALVGIISLLLISGCKPKAEEEKVTEIAGYPVATDIKERLSQYAPTEITYDETLLNPEQKQVLEKLIQAARIIDGIFWKQASHVGLKVRKDFENAAHPAAEDYLRYMGINFGPFDRLDENKPFIGTQPKPLGAGFYPGDLTKKEFQDFVASHPEMKKDLESPYTVVKRSAEGLVAVPYSVEYREDLEAVARYLKEAAELTANIPLKTYLIQKAKDLLTNDCYKSDCLWIDLEGNLLEIVIGPYEVYEDNLLGLKAAYESFVYINDFDEMKKIRGYLDYLGEMQEKLPVEKKYKDQEVVGLQSPLNVVIEVFTSGDTKAGVQTSAFVLPNDERIREEKGTKKVFLKNMMEAKFQKSLVPISRRVLEEADAERVSFSAYFTQTILHEIAHALGVNYLTREDGTRITVNKALSDRYSAIEELKADIAGLYNVPLLIEKGWIPADRQEEIYTTYLAGMFRAIRFGAHEAHGLGTLIQLNFYREKGAFIYEAASGKFRVDHEKIRDSIAELTRKILIIQGDGDYEAAGQLIETYGRMDAVIQDLLTKLKDIPVDIEPVFSFQK
ncbi:MAG: hypothetical protein ACE5LV_10240, partial [Candidatus Aminicenantales bacterium]